MIPANYRRIPVESGVHVNHKDAVCQFNRVVTQWDPIRRSALAEAAIQRARGLPIAATNINYTAPIPIITTSHFLRSVKPKVRVSVRIVDHHPREKVLPIFHKGRGIQMKNVVHPDHFPLPTKVPVAIRKRVLVLYRVKVR